MGSFDITCSLSRFPIECGEKAVFALLQEDDMYGFKLVGIPIHGIMKDCGELEPDNKEYADAVYGYLSSFFIRRSLGENSCKELSVYPNMKFDDMKEAIFRERVFIYPYSLDENIHKSEWSDYALQGKIKDTNWKIVETKVPGIYSLFPNKNTDELKDTIDDIKELLGPDWEYKEDPNEIRNRYKDKYLIKNTSLVIDENFPLLERKTELKAAIMLESVFNHLLNNDGLKMKNNILKKIKDRTFSLWFLGLDHSLISDGFLTYLLRLEDLTDKYNVDVKYQETFIEGIINLYIVNIVATKILHQSPVPSIYAGQELHYKKIKEYQTFLQNIVEAKIAKHQQYEDEDNT